LQTVDMPHMAADSRIIVSNLFIVCNFLWVVKTPQSYKLSFNKTNEKYYTFYTFQKLKHS